MKLYKCERVQWITFYSCANAEIILYMHAANERRCYIVTLSLIGWTHTRNDPWNVTYLLCVIVRFTGEFINLIQWSEKRMTFFLHCLLYNDDCYGTLDLYIFLYTSSLEIKLCILWDSCMYVLKKLVQRIYLKSTSGGHLADLGWSPNRFTVPLHILI